MIATIRHALLRIFDFYHLQAGRYRSFWPLYLFAVAIISALLAALVCLVALKVYDLHSYNDIVLRRLDLINEPVMQRYWTDVLSRIVTFFMVAFAAFAPVWSDAAPERIALQDAWRMLARDHAKELSWAVGCLLLIELLLFRELFRTGGANDAVWGPTDPFSDTSRVAWAVMEWVNSLVALLRAFVPYVLGLLFVARTWGIPARTVFKKYRTALFAMLILAFCLRSIQSDAINLISTFVWPIAMAPFGSPAIPIVLSVTLMIYLFSWAVPAYAGIVRSPLEHALEQERAGGLPRPESEGRA